jgi:predicted transposase YdaD
MSEEPSPQPLHQPHDKLFKLGFSQPAEAASFLSTVVPPKLSAAIDWSSLTLQPGSFIDSQYRHQESDLLFSVCMANTTARIYVLFEHQREQEPFIALRLLSYMARIWQSLQPKLKKGEKLPVILPVVLAQNRQRWEIRENFSALIDVPENPEEAWDYAGFVPDFVFRLVQLVDTPYEELPGTPTAQLVLRVLRAEIMGEPRVEQVWDEGLMEKTRREMIEAVLLYLAEIDVDKEAFLRRLKTVQNTKIKDSAMTVAQQLRQEGRQEGRIEMQQRDILEALEIRFERVPDGLAEEILSINDPAKLTLLHRAAIRSASLEEFANSL